MKTFFKKAVTVLGSAAMIGATMSGALAANYPTPFETADTYVVYGAGSSDSAAASQIAASLSSLKVSNLPTSSAVSSGSEALTDDEVELGGAITSGDIPSSIQDNKLSNLADTQFSWDDGDGADDYDYYEEIVIGTMNILTTTDDEDLEGIAMSNEEGLTYKLVLEDNLSMTAVGNDSVDSDRLFLTILGEEYEISSMTTTSITVVTSDEVSLGIGESYTTPDGSVVTVSDIYSTSVMLTVDGESEFISEDTSKKVNGVKIEVDVIGYHSNTPETSSVILKIGDDEISETFNSGDAYIGEEDGNALWEWEISGLNAADGYIGVTYAGKLNDASDVAAENSDSEDTIKYVGSGYVFPNNFAAVTLDSITDADYQDLKIYFSDSTDLYYDNDSTEYLEEDADVIVIEADNNDVLTVGSYETSKAYIWFNGTNIQTFYYDHDGQRTPSGKARLADATSGATWTGDDDMPSTTLIDVEIGDTNLDINMSVVAGIPQLFVLNTDDSDNQVLNLTIGGTLLNTTAAAADGTFERLGSTAEDAEAGDIMFDGSDVSTGDYELMEDYGIMLSEGTSPESQADDDEATLSVPEERVYAQVTVSLAPSVDGSDSGLAKAVMDSESSTYDGSDVIVVGGSCANTLAAELLGSAYCGESFTTATGVGSGQFMFQAFDRNGKTALLVAGYEVGDTSKAATYLLADNEIATTTGGEAVIYETATSTEVVAA